MLRGISVGQLSGLILLMSISALTDGIGIVMLVPLLGAMNMGSFGSIADGLLEKMGVQDNLGLLLALFVTLIAFRTLLMFALGQIRLRLQHGLVDRLRRRCYAALLGAEWRWLSGQHAGDQNATLLTNIATVGVGFDQLVGLAANLLMITAYIIAAFYLSWPTTLLALVLGGTALMALAGFRKRATAFGAGLTQANRELHRHVQQGLSSIRLAKIFANEHKLDAGFAEAIGAVRQTKLAYSRDTAKASACIQIGAALLLAALAYTGIILWGMPVAVLLPLLLVFIRLAPMLAMIQQGWNHILHAMSALDDVRSMIDEAQGNSEPAATANDVHLRNAIELSDVSVRYPARKRAALQDVSILIPANTTTAISGESGAGKSTLADLLMGLLKPDAGTLRIDGILLSGENRRNWRRQVAYVEQFPTLFHDSIRANLLWGKANASEAELIEALKAASADFVLASPGGLDSIVGDGGMRLSGGERQRITLARALLRRPALLILDEATSALDPENEAAIRRVLAELRGKLTIVLIGHQSSIREVADQIITLADGRIVSR
ncbi:ABC transporter ATP-binding protein [Sphingorhabdus sp.]|uniref:ABC transporter ATP-binding protein n=1 Tax=Sphingorhabdus sp. TaxID=1902408 RepID=UPI003BAE76EF